MVIAVSLAGIAGFPARMSCKRRVAIFDWEGFIHNSVTASLACFTELAGTQAFDVEKDAGDYVLDFFLGIGEVHAI
jgi:hypothetical protein